jgi:hypothetical protein
MHLVESLLNYSPLYDYLIPSTALRLKRLLCCCANFKSTCLVLPEVPDEEAPHTELKAA